GFGIFLLFLRLRIPHGLSSCSAGVNGGASTYIMPCSLRQMGSHRHLSLVNHSLEMIGLPWCWAITFFTAMTSTACWAMPWSAQTARAYLRPTYRILIITAS